VHIQAQESILECKYCNKKVIAIDFVRQSFIWVYYCCNFDYSNIREELFWEEWAPRGVGECRHGLFNSTIAFCLFFFFLKVFHLFFSCRHKGTATVVPKGGFPERIKDETFHLKTHLLVKLCSPLTHTALLMQ